MSRIKIHQQRKYPTNYASLYINLDGGKTLTIEGYDYETVHFSTFGFGAIIPATKFIVETEREEK